MRAPTHSESVNDAADNHLGKMPGNNLKNGADEVGAETDSNGLAAAELVTKSKGEDGSEEGTELYRESSFSKRLE